MGNCSFCDLAEGLTDDDLVALRTPSAFVVTVPSQRPLNQGHALVLPNQHITRLAELEGALLQELYGLAGRLSLAMQSAFGASGSTIFLNDNAPDQVLLHLHIHVVPRRPGDGFRIPDPNKVEVPHAVRVEQASALRRALHNLAR